MRKGRKLFVVIHYRGGIVVSCSSWLVTVYICVCIHITELNKLVLKLEKRAPDVGLVQIDAEDSSQPPPNDAPKWTIKSSWDTQRRLAFIFTCSPAL